MTINVEVQNYFGETTVSVHETRKEAEEKLADWMECMLRVAKKGLQVWIHDYDEEVRLATWTFNGVGWEPDEWRSFTKSDWFGYQGCEDECPIIFNTVLKVKMDHPDHLTNEEVDCDLIADQNTLQIYGVTEEDENICLYRCFSNKVEAVNFWNDHFTNEPGVKELMKNDFQMDH